MFIQSVNETSLGSLRSICRYLMHLSMVYPGIGGGGEAGNPRELDFVKRTWVGILTSTTVPKVGNCPTHAQNIDVFT